MATVETDVAMILGGSSELAYSMTITALNPDIAATKNKRSAHLVQQFMQEALKIHPQRGVVRYQTVAEENIATNGVTTLQEIEQLERLSHDEESGAFRALSRQKSRKSRRSSIRQQDRKTPTPALPATTPLNVLTEGRANKSLKLATTGSVGRWKLKPRKSIFGFFKRRSEEALKQ